MINHDHTKLSDPNIQNIFRQEVVNNVGRSFKPTYTELAGAATLTSLPKNKRAEPGWFRGNANKRQYFIEARN